MSLDQVVNADAEEILQNEDDEEDVYFQDIEVLQNQGIVSFRAICLIP